MSSNIAAFELGLEREEKEAIRQFDRRRRAVMLEAARGVIFLTPVDTGRARGNWQLTIEGGQPEVTENEDTSLGEAPASASRPPAGPTFNRINAGIGATKGKPFSRYDLVNGVPYIVRLEQGWSKQAPSGMVAITVDRLRRSGLVR